MKKTTTHTMVKIAFLTTLAVILFIFEFPLIPGSPLQADLSDLPVIFGGVLFGPGAVFIALPPALLFYKRKVKPMNQVLISIATVFIAAFCMHLFNYYVTFPLYGLKQDGAWLILRSVYLPFNLIKGSILMALFVTLKPYFDRMDV